MAVHAGVACACGRHYNLLIPAWILAAFMGEDWDPEECNRYNIELAATVQRGTDPLIDVRKTQTFQCVCGAKGPISQLVEPALPVARQMLEEKRRAAAHD